MTLPFCTDVLVVGAGPAGATTATALARHGLRVLLVDDKNETASHDVLVTGPALLALASIGVYPPPTAQSVGAIEMWFGATTRHIVTGSRAAVCDGPQFRQALRAAAVDAGARYVNGAVTRISRHHTALIVSPSGATSVTIRPVTARHIVFATGARAELVPDSPPHVRGVACAQRFTGVDLAGRVVLAFAAPSSADPDEQPKCAWALPAADGTVTVGTARVGDPARPANLMADALRTLAATEPRYSTIRPAGPLNSGPLSTGFAPERLAQAAAPIVGDAAGLVNPFTGEGVSYAVQSGLLAAQVIAANRSHPERARRMYARRLRATFVGYFETAHHAVRRYHLAWRVLAAGANSDHPFFAKGRRAILLPEGFSGLTSTERMDLTGSDVVRVGPFLAACDEVAISVVRREWPFLARLAVGGEHLGQRRLRPAVPFFAALLAAGNKPEAHRATLGAAIELALLGTLAVLGPAPPPFTGRGVDWAVTATVLAGDFLLSQASRLIAESTPEVSLSFADWLTELTKLRACRLDPTGDVHARSLYASLLEFPARLGAHLSGATPETEEALRDVGRYCGYAFGYAEDVLALRGERTRLDTTLAVMLRGQFSGIPELLGRGMISETTLSADQELRSQAMAAATTACEDARKRALKAVGAVPDPTAARILTQFVETITAPARTARVITG